MQRRRLLPKLRYRALGKSQQEPSLTGEPIEMRSSPANPSGEPDMTRDQRQPRKWPRSSAVQTPVPMGCLEALYRLAAWHQRQELMAQMFWPARMLDEIGDHLFEASQIAVHVRILQEEQHPSLSTPHGEEKDQGARERGRKLYGG